MPNIFRPPIAKFSMIQPIGFAGKIACQLKLEDEFPDELIKLKAEKEGRNTESMIEAIWKPLLYAGKERYCVSPALITFPFSSGYYLNIWVET